MTGVQTCALPIWRGDLLAARAAHEAAVATAGATPEAVDLLGAAGSAVATGDVDAALRHTAALVDLARDTAALVDLARDTADQGLEYRARFVAARAHDLRGAHPLADHVFHHHPLVRAHGERPVWADEPERDRMDLARATALRVRGEHRRALAVLEPVWSRLRAAHPAGDWQAAAVELARLRLLAGRADEGRALAEQVVDALCGQGLPRHHLVTLARTVLAEVELAAPRSRDRAVRLLDRALADATEWYGQDDPLTLEVMVLRGQAVQHDWNDTEAAAVLADAEKRTTAALGAEHPLTLRARLWNAMAIGAGGDWDTAADLLTALLPRHEAILGRAHPESQLTRLQLGLGLAMTNRPRLARPLVDEARHALGARSGPWRRWGAVATVGAVLTRLPGPLWRLAGLVDGVGRRRRG